MPVSLQSTTIKYKDNNGTYQNISGFTGEGVPSGGTTGQVLKKVSGTDYDTEWSNESGTVSDIQVVGASIVTNGVANIPKAGASTLGVVSPDAKTNTMTQSVGVDSNGKLWTTPGSGGGSNKTLLGEVSMPDTGVVWMAIQSIDYSTGIITVDDASSLPDSSVSYVTGRVAILYKNGFTNLKTIPQELIRSVYGITKLSNTTVQIQNVSSCTQTNDINLSGWYICYNPNGAASIQLSELQDKNHLLIEFYTRYCALDSGFNLNVLYDNQNKYASLYNDFILSSYFGGTSYETFSTRTLPTTNGAISGAIKGCGLPIYYTVDMQKHGDVYVCECNAKYAMAQNKTSMPKSVNDIVSILIDNKGISTIRANGGGDFNPITAGATLRAWEVND